MDMNRREYSRELKINVMQQIDGGRRIVEVARELALSPHMIEKWRALWRTQGEAAFPGRGRKGLIEAVSNEQRIADLERKIGQLTMENDFLKKSLERLRERPELTVVTGDAAYWKTTKKQGEKETPLR